jgi:hypothetical protein
MTTSQPPEFYFDGIDFNPEFFEDVSATLTKKECDARYLIKTEQDTATALETFNVGIKTNSIEPINNTDTLNINTVSSTATNIVNIGNNTTNEQTLNLNSKTINVGDTTVPSTINIISPSTFTGTATIPTIAATTINSAAVNSLISIGGNQINAGATLSIGNNTGRVGSINIATVLTTGLAQTINIGSASITSGTQTINLGGQQTISGGGSQTISVNKPLTIGYPLSAPTTYSQMGYTTVFPVPPTVVTVPLQSTTKNTIQTFTSLPAGIYMISMGVKCVYTTTNGGSHCDVDNFEFGLTTDPLTSDYLPCLGYRNSIINTFHQFNSNNIFNCSGILKNTTATSYYFTILATFDKVINANPFINITRIG